MGRVDIVVPGNISESVARQAAQAEVDRVAGVTTFARQIEQSAQPPSRLLYDAVIDREKRWRAIEDHFGLYTAAQVADIAGSVARNRSEYATARHRRGLLMALRRRGQLRFPGFQFDTMSGEVRPIVPQLIRVFTGAGWTHESIIQWCAAPEGYLDDAMPADVMGTRPADVLDAARNVAAAW